MTEKPAVLLTELTFPEVAEDKLEEYSSGLYSGKKSIKQAKSLMREFRTNGLLKEGNYDDDKWVFYTDSKRKYTTNFNLPLNLHYLKQQIKCWALEMMDDVAPMTVHVRIQRLNMVVEFTNGFDVEDKEAFDSILESIDSKIMQHLCLYASLNFLDYCDLDNREEVINELIQLKGKYKQEQFVRVLPHYRDVLLFDACINYLIKTWNYDIKLSYFPVVLWWKFTTAIPIRPCEFCDIVRDCLPINKSGRYFITIPRKKQKKTLTKLEVYDTLEITKELYDLITEYIKLSEPYGKTDTLLSYPLYKAFNSIGKPRNKSHNRSHEFFNGSNLRQLINEFYDNEIEPKLMRGEKLERVKLGDTRHFAFCNMMLMGLNALTIARLGGHRNIETQYRYQQHLDYFAQSKVYALTRFSELTSFFNTQASTIEIQDALNRSLLPMEYFEYLEKRDIGYCTDKEMKCESDDCGPFCSKWYCPKEELNRHAKRLLDLSSIKELAIKNRLKTMEELRKQMGFDIRKLTYSSQTQEALSREAQRLNGDTQDLAKVKRWLNVIDDGSVS